ncbi:MAG: hypothetical protein ACYDHT_03380 [Solirubrobacteraceae bacterium]
MSLRRMILASLAGGLMLASVGAASAAASPRLCVYAQERNVLSGAWTGHAFVQLLPDAGPQQSSRNLTYGFYPKNQALAVTGGPGQLKNDSEHGWEWKLCKSITDESYEKAARVISLDRDKTPQYSLGGFNCTDWVFKVAGAAGVQLPSARALGSGLFDPEELANKYKVMWRDQGSRNLPGGDAVFKNTANVFPNNATDPPVRTIDLDSYTDITLLAFTEPRTIAHALDMTARTAALPAETVGTGRALRISLAHLGALRTVSEVQFGDGSRQYQRRTFTHSYRRAGTYRLSGIAIANATVYRFSLPVKVVGGGGAVSTTTTVPQDAPHHYRFPQGAPLVVPLPI